MSTTQSKPKTISDSQLTVGALVLVRGNIEYSRLLRKIEGEELEKDKIRKAQAGMNPIDKPYTTIQLTNARIVPLRPNQGLSPEEIFVDERFYRRNGDPQDAPWHYTLNNKSPFPNLFYMHREGKVTEGDLITPENELARGLDVVLVLRIFQSSSFARKGIGLHSIILQEPIRYYTGDSTKALEDAGIILHGTPSLQSQMQSAQPQSQPAAQSNPIPAPAPGTAFNTQPAPAPAPAPAPMPAPASPWTCPGCGTLNSAEAKFCNNCGTAKAAAAGPAQPAGNNPYAAAAAAAAASAPQTGGIRYDAGDTGRNY